MPGCSELPHKHVKNGDRGTRLTPEGLQPDHLQRGATGGAASPSNMGLRWQCTRLYKCKEREKHYPGSEHTLTHRYGFICCDPGTALNVFPEIACLQVRKRCLSWPLSLQRTPEGESPLKSIPPLLETGSCCIAATMTVSAHPTVRIRRDSTKHLQPRGACAGLLAWADKSCFASKVKRSAWSDTSTV
jgi:hypothetical protein